MKVAVTFLEPFMVNVQVGPVPEQAPPHPVNRYPLPPVANRVTVVPLQYH